MKLLVLEQRSSLQNGLLGLGFRLRCLYFSYSGQGTVNVGKQSNQGGHERKDEYSQDQ